MKKMKLQMLGLSVNDLLSREQMKKVMGGSGTGSGGSGAGGYYCTATCAGSHNVTCSGFTGADCTAKNNSGCTGYNYNGGNPTPYSYGCGTN